MEFSLAASHWCPPPPEVGMKWAYLGLHTRDLTSVLTDQAKVRPTHEVLWPIDFVPVETERQFDEIHVSESWLHVTASARGYKVQDPTSETCCTTTRSSHSRSKRYYQKWDSAASKFSAGALSYKPEGRGFETQWGQWHFFFQFT
jgi:hypothetical protein